MKFLALKSIIAWRVMFVTYMNRQDPAASQANGVMSTHQTVSRCETRGENCPTAPGDVLIDCNVTPEFDGGNRQDPAARVS